MGWGGTGPDGIGAAKPTHAGSYLQDMAGKSAAEKETWERGHRENELQANIAMNDARVRASSLRAAASADKPPSASEQKYMGEQAMQNMAATFAGMGGIPGMDGGFEFEALTPAQKKDIIGYAASLGFPNAQIVNPEGGGFVLHTGGFDYNSVGAGMDSGLGEIPETVVNLVNKLGDKPDIKQYASDAVRFLSDQNVSEEEIRMFWEAISTVHGPEIENQLASEINKLATGGGTGAAGGGGFTHPGDGADGALSPAEHGKLKGIRSSLLQDRQPQPGKPQNMSSVQTARHRPEGSAYNRRAVFPEADPENMPEATRDFIDSTRPFNIKTRQPDEPMTTPWSLLQSGVDKLPVSRMLQEKGQTHTGETIIEQALRNVDYSDRKQTLKDTAEALRLTFPNMSDEEIADWISTMTAEELDELEGEIE
jgi:hypothetical protein